MNCLVGTEHILGFKHYSVSTAPGLSWRDSVGFQSGTSLFHVVALAPQRERDENSGVRVRDPTLAFHTHWQLLCWSLKMLCFHLVRKTIHLSPLYLFLPYVVVHPIRINNLALGQLEKAFKIKCVHLVWGREGPPSWSNFSRWPLNISGAGFIFICHLSRGSIWKWWENPFV